MGCRKLWPFFYCRLQDFRDFADGIMDAADLHHGSHKGGGARNGPYIHLSSPPLSDPKSAIYQYHKYYYNHKYHQYYLLSLQLTTMKKITLLIACAFCCLAAIAQQDFTPKISVKIVPTGLLLGTLGLQGEYSFTGKNSLTAKIGFPVTAHHTFLYETNDAKFDLKAFSFLAGYRTYLSKKHMRGLYFEPYLKYVNHNSEGIGTGTINAKLVTMSFSNQYNAAGLGVQLGTQFIIRKRFVIDFFFLGPEINAATSNFKAVETSSSLPWTAIESYEAEADIKNFIEDIPFISNRTEIRVNPDNRTVTADFKGPLPGLRVGISAGIAF